MSKFLKIFIIMIVGFFSSQISKSQNDTTFDTQILFKGEYRILSVHVPKLTNNAIEYKMFIWLHGMGDNSSDFMTGLLQNRLLDFLDNTVIVIPDGGNDQGRDFYTPTGDEDFIRVSMEWIKAKYPIDSSNIFLGGFSMGGRSALKYALDNPGKFRGLLLNTPAIQGIKESNNLLNFKFKFENSKDIPMAITNGASDIIYVNPIDTLYKNLIEHNCKVIKYTFVGMGHQIPGPTYLKPCFDFLFNPLKNQLDGELCSVIFPNELTRIYTPTIKPIIRIRNSGASQINLLKIKYGVNKVMYSYNWQPETQPLDPFNYVDITLPEIGVSEGVSQFEATIDSINGSPSNDQLSIKSLTRYILVQQNADTLPIKYGFESDYSSNQIWQIIPSGNVFLWGSDTTVSTEGSASGSMFNSPYLFDTEGMHDDFYSPVINLSTASHPTLSFDLAFNYLLFTQPYYPSDFKLTDTLRIYITTTNNPGTLTKIYDKSGASLATVSTPIKNPTDMSTAYFVPSSLSQWRRETVDLINYKNLSDAVLLFEYTSGLGGSIWIDNIKIDNITDVNDSEIADNAAVNVFPNPANDWININLPNNAKSIEIYTLEGIKLLSQDITNYENLFKLNVMQYNPGIYLIKIMTDDKILNERFVISR